MIASVAWPRLIYSARVLRSALPNFAPTNDMGDNWDCLEIATVLPQDLRSLKGHGSMSRSCRTAVVLQIRRNWPKVPRDERKRTRTSYCSDCIGYRVFPQTLHLRLWDRTAYYSRCRKLSRPRPLYTTELRRGFEKFVHYMRVGLDLLGSPASPTLPCLAHVGVFCR